MNEVLGKKSNLNIRLGLKNVLSPKLMASKVTHMAPIPLEEHIEPFKNEENKIRNHLNPIVVPIPRQIYRPLPIGRLIE